MISKELIKKIRRLEIKSNMLVEEIFSGEYRSGFRGKGMEFESIREYSYGDDIRNIDWNVTARNNNTFIKQFTEERELNMFLLIDMSSSNYFGKKKDLIAELSATLAFSAVKNNDRVGVVFFASEIEKFIPSKNGKKHVLSIIENILELNPKSKTTNISNVLNFFNRIEKKRSIVFLISDFFDGGYEKSIKYTSKYHDLVLLRIIDRAEETIPKGAIYCFEDLETGETIVVDNLKQDFKLSNYFNVSSNNLVNIYTDEGYSKPLKMFFKRRCYK